MSRPAIVGCLCLGGITMAASPSFAGGFEIPIGFLSGDYTEEFRDLKWQVYDQQIKQKIFAKIGIEPEQ